jgi:hypothetical protein
MFEGLLADVLDSLAGSFIQGLDRQNLNVGIWSGDVVLNELQVRGFEVEGKLLWRGGFFLVGVWGFVLCCGGGRGCGGEFVTCLHS